MSLQRSPRCIQLVITASLVASIIFFNGVRPAHAAYRMSVPIWGGSITVDNMSSIPADRIIWLVQIADRSTCRSDPNQGDCDGIMSSGDRVVIGDHYMALMDLSRGPNGIWGGGGGGLLRGLWLLVNEGNYKNFKYLGLNYNHAPNNLFPKQSLSPIGDLGDGHEIVVIWSGGSDPVDSFRASENANENLIQVTDGFYNSTPGWQHYYYHFQGTLSQGNGASGNPYNENINIGYPLASAKVTYRLQYWFFNNQYSGNSDNNQFLIQVRATLECSGGCAQTRPLNTFVSSLGLSSTSSISYLKINTFKPLINPMYLGNYWLNGQNCINTSTAFPVNVEASMPQFGWVSSLALPTGTFQAKVRNSEADFYSTRRIYVNRSTVGSTGVSLDNKVIHQLNTDAYNGAVVYDVQVGDAYQCASLGSLYQGQSLYSEFNLALEYESP